MIKDAHSDKTDRSGSVDMSGTGSCATPDGVLYGRLPGFGVGARHGTQLQCLVHLCHVDPCLVAHSQSLQA